MAKRNPGQGMDYAGSGVDIGAGEDAVERIKALARRTFNSCVLSEIGSFGGFFKPDLSGISSPVFVSSADGVGTKLKLAFMTGRHDTVGEDLVNHCVNDILVHGARPLFFLDYIATGKLKPDVVADIVSGLSRGCQNVGMALLGGETAEMPDFYRPGEYDLAGFIVGVVEQERIVNGAGIREGDVCIGLASNGLHTNGYALARRVAFDAAGLGPDSFVDHLEVTISEALMKVHTCYAAAVHSLLERVSVRGMAHITGGGLPGNLKRIIPAGLSAEIIKGSWPVPPIFEYLQKTGGVDESDMYDAFNMGIGYVLVVDPADADSTLGAMDAGGHATFRIGQVRAGEPKVRLT